MFKYSFKCAPPIVYSKSLNVFEEEGFGLMLAENGLYLKEQRTASFVLETEATAS